MKKYFLFLLVAKSSLVFSQYYIEERKTDSLKIDSMKMALPLLKDSAKVDCLNAICTKYYDFDMDSRQAKYDSISKYANKAYIEANSIGYQKGIAAALIKLGSSELYLRRTYLSAEKIIRQAIEACKNIDNAELSGDAYALLADLLGKKNDNEDEKVIEYDKKAIYYYHKAGASEKEAEWTTWLSWCYILTGNFEEGFPYCVKAVEFTKKSAHTGWGHNMVEYALEGMSNLYNIAGDYTTALDYLRQASQYGIAHNTGDDKAVSLGILFRQMGHLDSSFLYLQKNAKEGPDNPFAQMFLGETYLSAKEYDTALKIFLDNVDKIRSFNGFDDHLLTECLLNIGKGFAGEKKYSLALKYAKEGFERSKKYGVKLYDERSYIIEGYELLSDIYHHLGKDDTSYDYLKKYTTLKDSIQNKQFIWRLNNQLNNYKKLAGEEKTKAKILLLNKDNQLKDAQLKQESIIKYFLITGLIILFIAGIFIYRSITLKRKTEKLEREQLENNFKVQQLENEKKQAELQHQAAELEMQALRAQMNPHFIFNCLSSINRIILKNESKTASDYLTRFSRLIRMVLINSQKEMIPLEDELQMLRLYLDMERLRFKNSFDYSIIFTNAIDSDAVLIPPLLLQPFCENAVWHGLMQKEEQGHLSIELSMLDNVLFCIISDDGIGREKAAELKSKSAEKEKSMGLKITTQRLALLNQNKNVQTFYTIEDITDENKNTIGTKVILKIAYKELREEFV
jgi:tetratricopeptide (TPR) repeat protein/anti-sigma regulatory factor (Ser/Thr protein kinase)